MTLTLHSGDEQVFFYASCAGAVMHGEEDGPLFWTPTEPEAAEAAYYEAQAARGSLAGAPETLDCYPCGHEARAAGGLFQTDTFGLPYITRTVTALGHIAEAHRDPTQTYLLDCGHTAF